MGVEFPGYHLFGMRRIVVFDFDGTLTNRDTLIELLAFARGKAYLIFALLLFLPLLVLMKLHWADNGRTKERLFGFYFKGMTLESFNDLCQRFVKERGLGLHRQTTWKALNDALRAGDEVAVVSASIDNWVAPFFRGMPVKVIGTQVTVKDSRLTGRFNTSNCYGAEKVRRLEEALPELRQKREDFYVVAYGDSRGDREMLAYADESHYKPFKNL